MSKIAITTALSRKAALMKGSRRQARLSIPISEATASPQCRQTLGRAQAAVRQR
ncbi:hypothetical protein [Noviherbaspirillum humi]|uniref:hypothetical protein n=1 Tax=Noviherbaspirillum humi TaxID=1688639 RepID=UPI0015951FAF|nr:hypothetical protein [Noviherbaspirillum humi]